MDNILGIENRNLCYYCTLFKTLNVHLHYSQYPSSLEVYLSVVSYGFIGRYVVVR